MTQKIDKRTYQIEMISHHRKSIFVKWKKKKKC